ncbi:MAG: hypothetical protein A2168_02035 [Planctomycetes bacterium RBG_13_50_24]|nr:MAG: hypothetical protein A2168_02035 [Planctomycetes bacterium RBG_13_50_24]
MRKGFTINNRFGLLRRINKYRWRFIMRNGKIPAKTENVRKIWLLGLALMIIGLGGSNASAMDLMGPPTAELEKGMIRGGIEYSSSSMYLELIEGKATVYSVEGVLPPLFSGAILSETITDYKVNTIYASVGYGITENCEAFIRMGAAKATFGDTLWKDNEEFDSGNIDFAIGGGVKATFYEGFDWKIGGLVQINLAELDGKIDSSSWTIPQPHFVEISTTEMQIAMGATYLWTGWLSIYGGPFAHFINGDFDYELNRITEDVDSGQIFNDTREYSWQITKGPTFGGYIGAQIEIAKNYSANIEYQKTSNANVFGASIMMRY